MKNVQPINDYVLVKILQPDKTTQSGIVLPDTAQERPQEGEVIAAGDGKKINERIVPGKKIIFAKYSGTEIKINDEDHLLLKGEDILAIIE